MPGPGQYTQGNLIGGPDSLKFTVGIKPYSRNGNRNPGPGTYAPNDQLTVVRSPSPQMSRSKKGLSVSRDAAENPGPGAYEPQSKRYANINFSMSELER